MAAIAKPNNPFLQDSSSQMTALWTILAFLVRREGGAGSAKLWKTGENWIPWKLNWLNTELGKTNFIKTELGKKLFKKNGQWKLCLVKTGFCENWILWKLNLVSSIWSSEVGLG